MTKCKDDSCNFDYCVSYEGDPFEQEQDIWNEHYKLENYTKDEIKPIKENLSRFYLQQVAQVEYQSELLRQNGHSGLCKSRQYNYEYSNDVGYAAVNIHNHANAKGVCGSAEFSGVLNGYYFRSRHNDYVFSKNVEDGEYLQVEDIQNIPVPSDITGTPEQQINKARDYFRALAGEIPQSSVQHFDTAFKWVMSYIECWWEYLEGDEFNDAFFSPRHRINADNIRDLIARDQYYSYGGHKNRLENQAHLPVAIKDVDSNGNPILCVFKYRCVCKEIGSLVDYPISSTIEPVYDYLSLKRFGNNHTSNSRRNRFRITRRGYNKRIPGLLDELMGKIYGLNGENSYLEEVYKEKGAEVKLLEYGTTDPLNAAKYSRFYSFELTDASGRSDARRGFHDPMMFAAKTTRPEVFTRRYDDAEYAFSYAIPFEMHIQTFLDEWNPYSVPKKNNSEFSGKTGSEANPYPGYSDIPYYYHTPLELFTGISDSDPADTSATAKYVECGDGVVRPHVASGIWIFLPEMAGINNKIRTRYPVYPVYWEGNETHEQMKAWIDTLHP